MSLSPEMTRFFAHVQNLPDTWGAAHTDDAAEELERLSCAQLAIICRTQPEGLRERLSAELDEIELNLPEGNREGWVKKLAKVTG